MQTPLSPRRANRVPRVIHTQPGPVARLRTWLRRKVLITRLAQLENAKRDLQRLMAMDKAAALAHRISYTKSPVLQERMRRELDEYARLTLAIGDAKAQLAELEQEQ